jgi:hypothetical protein
MAISRSRPSRLLKYPGSSLNTSQTQRDKYTSGATQLSAQQKAKMAGRFSLELQHNARLLVLSGEWVINPDFHPMLRNWGFRNLPDQSAMGAITFSDTVVSHGPFTDGLLFHELVHVEQHPQLGIPVFPSYTSEDF